MTLELRAIRFREAAAFVPKTALGTGARHHRHHPPPTSWQFGTAAYRDGELVGVVMAGRPVARALDDGLTLEVTRCCTDGSRNACSFLYAAVRRAAKALGYRRLITYTLDSEHGASLLAAGWRPLYLTTGGSWDTPSRPRATRAPMGRKRLWEAAL